MCVICVRDFSLLVIGNALYHHYQRLINHCWQIFALALPPLRTQKCIPSKSMHASCAPICTALINVCLFLIITILCGRALLLRNRVRLTQLSFRLGCSTIRPDFHIVDWANIAGAAELSSGHILYASSWGDIYANIYDVLCVIYVTLKRFNFPSL